MVAEILSGTSQGACFDELTPEASRKLLDAARSGEKIRIDLSATTGNQCVLWELLVSQLRLTGAELVN